jgi:hypothetical protein
MSKGITNLTEKRLAQIAPEKTTVYVAWLDTYNDSGWGWGLEEDNLEFISYDSSERYDPELGDTTPAYLVRDPRIDDETLKGMIKEDENFPQELKNSVVFDISRQGLPENHPYDDEKWDVGEPDEGDW